MKDQRALLHKCMNNEIPVFVLCGNDVCAIQALEEYLKIAEEKGCNHPFLEDLKLLIGDFKAYQIEEPKSVKIPD